MRRVQFRQLIEDLKAATGQGTSSSVGVNALTALKYRLNAKQRWLYDTYDWPHMRITSEIALATDQRYYDLPADMNFERIEEAAILWSGRPHPVERGISFEQYAVFNSDDGETSSPARRWDLKRPDTDAAQIEIWPIPADNDMKLQFRGIRLLTDLVADDDLCWLDGDMLVEYCAADILKRDKSEDADVVREQANSRRSAIAGNTQAGAKVTSMGTGRGNSMGAYPSGVVIVRAR